MKYILRKFKPVLTNSLLRRTAPCIAEQFFMVFVNIVNIMLLGNVSKEVMTAASMSNQLFGLIQVSFVGLCTGATVVIGRIWGSGEEKEVPYATFQAIMLIVLSSMVVTLVIYIFKAPIISLFFSKAEPVVLKNINAYIDIVFTGLPALAVMAVINSSVRGVGDNKTPLYATICLNAVSLILSCLLIYGYEPFGIAPMGIYGAAIGITVARYFSAIFVILLIYCRKSPVAPKLEHFKWFDKHMVGRIFNVGVPSFIEQAVFQSGFLITQTLLLGFGTVFQAGYQISTTIKGLTDSVGLALGVAQTALISQSLGAHGYRRAEEFIKAGNFLLVAIFVPATILMYCFAPNLAKMFSTDAEVINSSILFIKIWSIITFLSAYTQMTSGILRGAGEMRYVAVTGIMGLWITRIFGIWFLCKFIDNGYIIFALCIGADLSARNIMYYFRLKKGNWKYLKV